MAYATQESIRDRVYTLIESLVPTTDATRFRRYRNEWGADFAESAEMHPDASLRRFQVRQVDTEELPEVSSGLEERVRLTLEIRISYPQSHRYGNANAMDRDDVIRQDMLKINSAIGIYGRANFSSTNDCTPLGATPDRETGQAVDFLLVRAEFEYLRQIAVINTTLTATLTESADPLTADGGAFTYTLAITNTGSVDANSVTAVVTLPSGVGYTSASGTGWNIARSGVTVTCTRPVMSTGAAPSITINCTAPTDASAGSITATAEVTAVNVLTAASASQVTTLTSLLIVVLAGQSNAVGKVDIDDATDQTLADEYANVTLVQKVSVGTLTDPITWTVDDSGALAPRADATQNFGPELSMGRALDAVASRFAIVKYALTGSSLADNWLPNAGWPTSPSADPDLFDQFMAYLSAAETSLNGDIAALVWVQGETDGLDATDAGNYDANLATFFAAVRAVYPDLPIVISRQSDDATVTHKATIRAAQAAFVANNPTNTYLVDTDDMTLVDAFHFSADSLDTLGQRYADRVLALLDLQNRDPVASFTSSPSGLEVTFTDTSTDPGDTISSWLWNFGDSNTSTEQNPVHTYASADTYTVTLTVTDSHSATDQESANVTVSSGSWTSDATSGKGCPADRGEVASLLTACGLSGTYDPDLFIILPMQEASGNLTDTGTAGLTFTASGASLLYQQTDAGWARKYIATFENTAHRWACTDAALPDMSSGSLTALVYAKIASTTTNVARSALALGTGPVSYIGGAASTRVQSGANGAASATTDYGTWRPYWLIHDASGSSTQGNDDKTLITPTFSGLVTGKGITLGNVSAVVACPTTWYVYGLIYRGAITAAHRKTITEELGWAVSWTP